MSTFYECKVKYRNTDETGGQKIVTEAYLVDGVSFTDAETMINEKMREYISEEFKVTNIRVVNYAEVNNFENSDKWFKCKVSLIAYDEETGKERKQNMFMLNQANDVDDAYANTVKAMKNSLGDYSITAITETAIVEVFHYVSES